MSSHSHASYSSRLSSSKTLVQYIDTFLDYDPGDPNLTSASLATDNDDLQIVQDQHTQKHYLYSQAATDRKKFFVIEPESIGKLISPIGSNIRGKFGKDSQQYKSVKALINKIRGEKPIKITIDSSVESISRCEKSFGSQLSYFKDIITLLSQFGTAYAPANTAITILNLQLVLSAALVATNSVATTFANYKPLIESRSNGFISLHTKSQEIKDMVKSQYTIDSHEYKLVKGLRI